MGGVIAVGVHSEMEKVTVPSPGNLRVVTGISCFLRSAFINVKYFAGLCPCRDGECIYVVSLLPTLRGAVSTYLRERNGL